jgi:hypothetical protein
MLAKVTLTVAAIAALGLASGVTQVQAQETARKPRHCVQSLVTPNTPAVCYDNFTATIAARIGYAAADDQHIDLAGKIAKTAPLV